MTLRDDMTSKFTVYTPCLDATKTLHRVAESLAAQTVDDFEWLVVDDASGDATSKRARELADEHDLPLQLLRFDERRGKPASANRAVEAAQGELFVTADADDRFREDALEVLAAAWQGIPKAKRGDFAGVIARVGRRDGQRLGDPLPSDPWDGSLLALRYEHDVRAEMWNCIRTDVRAAFPFPEVDHHVPESGVWHRIGARYRFRFVDEVLRTYYADEDDSLMDTPLFAFAEGGRRAIIDRVNAGWAHFPEDPPGFLRQIAMLARLDHYTDRAPTQTADALNPRLARTLYWTAYPLTWPLGVRDRRRWSRYRDATPD